MRGQAVRVVPLRGREFPVSDELVTESCGECGILFAFPSDWKRKRVEDRGTWYCPNGHARAYNGPTEADRLRDDLARKQREVDGALDRLNAEKEAHATTEKERRRIVQRVKAGVCIDCNRTFQNLAQHMTSEHGSGATGSLGQIVTAMLVHKKHGYGWGARTDGSHVVRCGAQKVPSVRAVHRWRDVTCPDCRKDGGLD